MHGQPHITSLNTCYKHHNFVISKHKTNTARPRYSSSWYHAVQYVGINILEVCTGHYKVEFCTFRSAKILSVMSYHIQGSQKQRHLLNYVSVTVLIQIEYFSLNATVLDVKTITVMRIHTVIFRFKTPCSLISQSRYRPEVPRGFQEVKVPRLCDNVFIKR